MEKKLFRVSFITTSSFSFFIFILQDACSNPDIPLEY